MTTKSKPEKLEDLPPVSASSPVGPGVNDRREDGAPVLGGFVEVTKGDDEGFFGIFVELQGDTAVVRSHNDVGHRISVPFADLKASALHRA